ncbi:MAG: hypothetical protein GYA39_04220 [Methanothrix sp.]|nr:hypothetical protein [Methanothrix sp.]
MIQSRLAERCWREERECKTPAPRGLLLDKAQGLAAANSREMGAEQRRTRSAENKAGEDAFQ